VSVEAIGEEIGHILLQEPNHGVLLPPYRTQPRADAFERVLTASVVQEPSDWLVPSKNTSRYFSSSSSRRNTTKSAESGAGSHIGKSKKRNPVRTRRKEKYPNGQRTLQPGTSNPEQSQELTARPKNQKT
jgi:hypothetical protein